MFKALDIHLDGPERKFGTILACRGSVFRLMVMTRSSGLSGQEYDTQIWVPFWNSQKICSETESERLVLCVFMGF